MTPMNFCKWGLIVGRKWANKIKPTPALHMYAWKTNLLLLYFWGFCFFDKTGPDAKSVLSVPLELHYLCTRMFFIRFLKLKKQFKNELKRFAWVPSIDLHHRHHHQNISQYFSGECFDCFCFFPNLQRYSRTRTSISKCLRRETAKKLL